MSLRIQRIDNAPAVVNEEGTLLLTGTLTDENGDPIEPDDLEALTLTLYDEESDEIINSRDEADISSSLTSGGAFALTLFPDDNALEDADQAAGTKERHVALVRYEWGTPTKKDSTVIRIDVVRVHRLPE